MKNYFRTKWRYKSGLTLPEKAALFAKQNGLCALCGLQLPENLSKVHTDHDHVNKRVRGLLHAKCNTAVGFEETQPGLLDLTKSYLNHHK